LARGELSILAARTSIGKTSLAVQIAENCAKRGNPSLVVSLEMTGRELVNRILAKYTKIDGRKMRERRLTDSELQEMHLAAHAINDIPLLTFDPPEATAGQIRGVARMEHARRPLSLLVVDYIALVKPTNRNREVHEQLGDTCILLKSVAKELDIPVLCLAQLNRNAEDDIPTLAMLKSSGAIEEHADQVMFLHKAQRTDREVTFIMAKNRNGDLGKITLGWDAATTSFYDPNEPTPDPIFDRFNKGEF
jgi:replicative DNA helicase